MRNLQDRTIASTPPSTPSSWLPKTLKQLNQLKKLKPNCYGAAPVDPQSVQAAHKVLTELSRQAKIETPLVTASPDGNVMLCWDNGVCSLDAEIHPDGRFEYAFIHEQDPSLEQEGSTKEIKQLALLLAKGF